jgi:hypothetical protein
MFTSGEAFGYARGAKAAIALPKQGLVQVMDRAMVVLAGVQQIEPLTPKILGKYGIRSSLGEVPLIEQHE